jgi:hypothetical protein
MRRKFTSRPTPGASALAAIVGVFILIIAVAVMGPIISQSGNTPPAMILFLVVWVLGLIGMIGYNIVNAARPGGVPTQIVELQDDDSGASALNQPKSPAERLQELDDLRNRNLVSATEYAAKREEILARL